MFWFFLIVGSLLLIFAAGFFFERRSILKEILAIKSTATSTVAQLKELSHRIGNERGSAGAFQEQVEVKGFIRSNNPMTAQLSERPCVYSKMRVVEKYEETYYEEDEDGNRESKTRRDSTTLADNNIQISFQLEEKTGIIQIDPNGAKIEAIEVVDGYELPRDQNQGTVSLSFGGFSLTLPSRGFNNNKRILGYQYNEWILPIDTQIYVLGEVTDSDGTLKIQQPANPEHPFLISHKSEEQLLRFKERKAHNKNIASIVCFVLGIICIVGGAIAGV